MLIGRMLALYQSLIDALVCMTIFCNSKAINQELFLNNLLSIAYK